MFGVGAYDKDNNELDTLDGVTLNWFVGAHRDIAKFHGTQTGRVIIFTKIFNIVKISLSLIYLDDITK